MVTPIPPSQASATAAAAILQPGTGKKITPMMASTWIPIKYRNVLRSPSATFHHGAFHGSGPRLERIGALLAAGSRGAAGGGSVMGGALYFELPLLSRCNFF